MSPDDESPYRFPWRQAPLLSGNAPYRVHCGRHRLAVIRVTQRQFGGISQLVKEARAREAQSPDASAIIPTFSEVQCPLFRLDPWPRLRRAGRALQDQTVPTRARAIPRRGPGTVPYAPSPQMCDTLMHLNLTPPLFPVISMPNFSFLSEAILDNSRYISPTFRARTQPQTLCRIRIFLFGIFLFRKYSSLGNFFSFVELSLFISCNHGRFKGGGGGGGVSMGLC